MHQDFLESTAFYHRHYHRFSSRVIVPSFCLLICFLLFALFAKKELSLTTTAKVEPYRVLETIQSRSDKSIIENHLEESKVVQAGDLLLAYQTDEESLQLADIDKGLTALTQQKEQLLYLTDSIKQGRDQFPQADNFGYQERMKHYFHQVELIRQTVRQENQVLSSQNEVIRKSREEIEQQIQREEKNLINLQAQKREMQTKHEEDKQALVALENQLAQVEMSLSTYRSQLANLGVESSSPDTLTPQLEALKAHELAKLAQELTELEKELSELESRKQREEQGLQSSHIRAKEEGILHLNPEIGKPILAPTGTLLAQVYPVLEKEKRIKLVAYISSQDIASIQLGDSVRFTTGYRESQPLVLTSQISWIAQAAREMEGGSFFRVEAETDLDEKDAQTLRYGVEGKLTMITGTKTYFNEYMDKFFR